MTAVSDPVLWAAFVVAAVGSYLVRSSFLVLFQRVDEVPPRVERALELVPAAALAALVLPALVAPEGSLALLTPKVAAGGVATAVAWRTESMTWTLAAGMGTLWLLLAL
ncbi:AzlD domain-containing protein [Haloarchaeobius iranensis]|uniref:Branched-chain amino acid transport protein n=1 Tax=Haloarchaeobius iranensis TaxID=996166 RepID=A0A1G9ZT25_9EURY|nr:AzlD domain-containing protein [Haloarchaeobius iranensis]SDN24438.1 Branched-chain amino acid transport protein [Haloarchaeobius iranensis]